MQIAADGLTSTKRSWLDLRGAFDKGEAPINLERNAA